MVTEAELMMQMVNLSDALDKLAALGTPDQIRDYLVKEGLVGLRGAATACPVQRYLARQVQIPDSHHRYSVRTDVTWLVQYDDDDRYCGELHVPHPIVVEEFINRFDHRYYPELEANSCD